MTMKTIELSVNGKRRTFEGDPDKPLLWVLRDDLRLTGTKYGCGAGVCGACTVLVGGEAVRSCARGVGSVGTQAITTIEGLAKGERLHPVQQAWIDEDVAQCGYCQAGQILATVALLQKRPNPSATDIASITNLCRCGTYPRIRKAIAAAARKMGGAA